MRFDQERGCLYAFAELLLLGVFTIDGLRVYCQKELQTPYSDLLQRN